jgi:hypothetical protein
MIELPLSVQAWGTPAFRDTLKREIEQLDAKRLPLQQGLSRTSYAADRPHTALILGSREDGRFIRARVGIFYAGIVAGCSCADDPTPVTEEEEYCELQLDIERTTAQATVTLVQDAE